MKKGISLIVLVITIIVIIIIAGAVIFSLAQNNPISQANEATRAQDAKEIESAVSMYLGAIMAQYKDQVQLDVATSEVLEGNAIAVVNKSGVKLWRNGTKVVAAATEPELGVGETGEYKALEITADNVGLSGWPQYAGYNLTITKHATVSYVAE